MPFLKHTGGRLKTIYFYFVSLIKKIQLFKTGHEKPTRKWTADKACGADVVCHSRQIQNIIHVTLTTRPC